ncbi:hypothetical protein Plhal703r1_c74g0172391 [Plasmopara halstedii]
MTTRVLHMPYKWHLSSWVHKASRALPDIWRNQIVRYCRQAVCKSGWSIHLAQLQQNLFDDNGAGYVAIARRVLPMPEVVLYPGIYLVGVFKKNAGSLLCAAGHRSRRSDNS